MIKYLPTTINYWCEDNLIIIFPSDYNKTKIIGIKIVKKPMQFNTFYPVFQNSQKKKKKYAALIVELLFC